jgi:flavin-dependent dehydrogenase
MDQALANIAIEAGVGVKVRTRVTDVAFADEAFSVTTQDGRVYTSNFVLGCWGKRETMDKQMERPFIEKRTRYMGVKYHIRTDYPIDEIGLDNFEGGYCGIVKIEGAAHNLCNFYRRPADQRNHGSVEEYEEQVVKCNPIIKTLFEESEFLWETPIVINEVSFAPKQPVEQHIIMCGDSAGLITPLCGNGMSMALTAGRMAADLLKSSGLANMPTVLPEKRSMLEACYARDWERRFKQRLWWGRTIQRAFGSKTMTEMVVRLIHAIPAIEERLIAATHG